MERGGGGRGMDGGVGMMEVRVEKVGSEEKWNGGNAITWNEAEILFT